MNLKPAILAVVIALGPASVGHAAIPSECASPDEQVAAIIPLPHVAEALKPNAQLNVLAVGSASLFGPDAANWPGAAARPAASAASSAAPEPEELRTVASDAAFPLQMAHALEAAAPGAKVELTVRGGRGVTAQKQLELIRTALETGHYQLVLWQTGTVEAVRNLSPADFADTLAQGANLVAQHGAELVLIDPQFSRFLQTNSDVDAYELAFQQVGALPGVMLFHRFAVMRAWVNAGRFDLERAAKPARRAIGEQLHACLGQQLAEAILQGEQQSP